VQARDLRDALNVLQQDRALTEETLGPYFVQRPNSPIGELRVLLQDAAEAQKILFTGHRGNGKSTELARLSSNLRFQFFVLAEQTFSTMTFIVVRRAIPCMLPLTSLTLPYRRRADLP